MSNFGRFWKVYRNFILLGLLNLLFYSCQRLERPQFSNFRFVLSMYVWLYVCQVFTTPRAVAFSSAPKLILKVLKPLKLPLALDIGIFMHWSIGALVHQYNILHIEANCILFHITPILNRRCRFPSGFPSQNPYIFLHCLIRIE